MFALFCLSSISLCLARLLSVGSFVLFILLVWTCLLCIIKHWVEFPCRAFRPVHRFRLRNCWIELCIACTHTVACNIQANNIRQMFFIFFIFLHLTTPNEHQETFSQCTTQYSNEIHYIHAHTTHAHIRIHRCRLSRMDNCICVRYVAIFFIRFATAYFVSLFVSSKCQSFCLCCCICCNFQSNILE